MSANTLRRVIVVVAVAWVTTTLLYVAFSKHIVEASYRGTSVGILNHIVSSHRSRAPERHDLAYYQHKRTTPFLEVSLIFALCESYLILELRRNRVVRILKGAVRNFVTSVEHPLNLAIFRIVFFGFWAWWFRLDMVVLISQMPRELQVPPPGFGWLLSGLSRFDPAVITILGWILRTTCITAMIGLLTGPSAFVVAILGFVLCGISQSYGKLDAHGYMIWFAALLAVSRCADMLSVDAVIRAVRCGDKGVLARALPSRAYALPLRLIWTLMGIYYFFAGMWKAIDGGWGWIFSENLRYRIYASWYPQYRISSFAESVTNHHAWLLRFGGIYTVGFELCFIVLILSPRGRAFLIAAGLFFHNSLRLLTRDTFLDLQLCYVSLVDWYAIFRWLGKRCFSEPLYVVYQAECNSCRRTVSCLQVVDILERVTYVDATFEQTVRQRQSNRFGQVTTLHDIHTVGGDGARHGWFVYVSIAKRIPLLWFVYPVLFLWRIPIFGRRIHSTAIYSTRRNVEYPKMISRVAKPANSLEWAAAPRMLTLVGVILIGSNSTCGLLHVHGWPFTCGPAFSDIVTAEIRTLAIELIDGTGTIAVYDSHDVSVLSGIPAPLVAAIFDNIYRHPERPELPTAVCEFLRKRVRGWNNVASIRFYVERLTVVPTEQSKNPLDRQLFFECKQYDIAREP